MQPHPGHFVPDIGVSLRSMVNSTDEAFFHTLVCSDDTIRT